jgi:predicted transcriptional regulator of viral defense system
MNHNDYPVCPLLIDLLDIEYHRVYSASMSIELRHTSKLQKLRTTLDWPSPEADYIYVSSILNGLSKPRDRISRWLRSGELIRVKKGLYVAKSRSQASLEILANLIYGPSYISLEYALAHYGLIPERVEEVTSMTLARSKTFSTPIGRFSYRRMEAPRYAIGITQAAIDDRRRYLIATPEKALADLLWVRRTEVPPDDVEHFLFEEMRIDAERLTEISATRAEAIAALFQCEQVDKLADLVRNAKRRKSR